MSYYTININDLEKMYEEYTDLMSVYENTIEVVMKEKDLINVSDIAAGADMDDLVNQWVFKLNREMPETSELLRSAKNYIDGLKTTYKARKYECCNFITAFGEVNEYSVSDMRDKVACDTDIISDLVDHCSSILTNLDLLNAAYKDIANDWLLINYKNTELSSTYDDFDLSFKKIYDSIEQHKEDLITYAERMVDADDRYKALVKERLPQYVLLAETPNELVMPDELDICTFDNTSAIVDNLIRLTSTPYWDPTIKCKVMKSTSLLIEKGSEKDIVYVVNKIGNDDWNDYQSYVNARFFVYGTNYESDDICNALVNNMVHQYTDAETGIIYTTLDIEKVESFNSNIDSETEGKAYYSMARFSNAIISGEAKYTVCHNSNGEMVLYISADYDLNGNETDETNISLAFIDMNELIGEEGKTNLKYGMNFSDVEYVNYLSSICSDEDVLLVCELARIEKGDEDAYLEYFSNSPIGATTYYTNALSDYMMHLGDYGSAEYYANIQVFINSICNSDGLIIQGGHTLRIAGNEYDFDSSIDRCTLHHSEVYLDLLQEGWKHKKDSAYENLDYDNSYDAYWNTARMTTMHTFVSSVDYMYDSSISNLKVAGDNVSIIFNYDESNSDYYLQYKFIRNTSINSGINTITVFGYDSGLQLVDCEILQENKDYHWDKSMIKYRMGYDCAKAVAYGFNAEIGSTMDMMESATLDEKINTGSVKVFTPKSQDLKAGVYLKDGGESAIIVQKGEEGKYSKTDTRNNKFNAGLKVGTTIINAVLDDKKITAEWDNTKKDEWIDVYGDKAGFMIEGGNYDMNLLTSDKMYVVTSWELCSPAGVYLGNAIGDGLISEYFPEEDWEKIETKIASIYDPGTDDYNNLHGMIFGGYNPVQQMQQKEFDQEKYDDYVKAIDGLFYSFGQKNLTYKGICADYTDDWDEGVMYK